MLDVTYRRIKASLVKRFGTPRYTPIGSGRAKECGFSVIALGKLGASELNYSSDIDLMFIYTAQGYTDGVAPIFDHLAETALEMMERNLSAELCRASECPLEQARRRILRK